MWAYAVSTKILPAGPNTNVSINALKCQDFVLIGMLPISWCMQSGFKYYHLFVSRAFDKDSLGEKSKYQLFPWGWGDGYK